MDDGEIEGVVRLFQGKFVSCVGANAGRKLYLALLGTAKDPWRRIRAASRVQEKMFSFEGLVEKATMAFHDAELPSERLRFSYHLKESMNNLNISFTLQKLKSLEVLQK